jgi:Fe-Mn family superoxide dismutase
MSESITRRETLLQAALGGAILMSGCKAGAKPRAESPEHPRADAAPPSTSQGGSDYQPKPLGFDPGKLPGLSERLLTSHHDKNYAGAVKKLNDVERRIAELPADAPGYLLGALLRSQQMFRNSVVLHELYFDNLGGNGKLEGALAKTLTTSFGSIANFETQFRAVGLSLAGGSGWALFSWDRHRGRPLLSRSGSHLELPSESVPLCVLDMYEHSYHLDYGADTARYVDAFFRNLDYGRVEQRFQAMQGGSG